jgi:hypothetical protein
MLEYLDENIPMDKWMRDILQTSQRLSNYSTNPNYKSEEL